MVTGMRSAREVLVGALALIVGTGALSLGSKVITGEWTQWLRVLPSWAWGVTAVALLIAAAATVAARTGRRPVSHTVVRARGIQIGGWTINAEGSFHSVSWRYVAAARGVPSLNPPAPEDVDIDSLEVRIPPLCPRCRTELEETRPLGFFRWTCVGCGWSKLGKRSFYEVAESAERFLRGKWRQEAASRRP